MRRGIVNVHFIYIYNIEYVLIRFIGPAMDGEHGGGVVGSGQYSSWILHVFMYTVDEEKKKTKHKAK